MKTQSRMIRRVPAAALWVGLLMLAGSGAAWSMGEVATLPLLSGEDTILSAAMESTATYAYFGTDVSSAAVKVRLSDLVLISTVDVGVEHLTTVALDSSATYGYFGSSTTPAKIVKVDLTSFTVVASLNLAFGENYASSVVIDSASVFAYFGTNTSPGKIVKVKLSNLSRVSSLTLPVGEDYLTTALVDPANAIGYFGTNTMPGKIVKVNLTTLSTIATLTLTSSEGYLTSAVISTTTGFAYFGTNTSPGKVIKIRLSDMTEQGTLTLLTGEDYLTSAVIDSSATYTFFGTNTSPGQVVRVKLSDMTRSFTSTLATGENALLAAVMYAPGSVAYFGAGTVPGQIIKMDFLDTRTGPPLIITQPADANANPGGMATFSVSPLGSSPFTYQWQLNGVAISGATSASYTTGAVSFSDNSSGYSCVVTNALGTTTTRIATLTVLPTIKVYPNPWRSDRHSGLPMTFEGAAPGSTLKIFTLSMHWVKSVDGGGTLPLIWDRTNDAGQSVASGYYFFLVTTSDQSQTVHGKFAIIK